MVSHQKLNEWVNEIAQMTQPDNIHWCDGSQEEYDRLTQECVEQGSFFRLDEEKRPNTNHN